MNIFYPAYKTSDREIGWIVSETGRIFIGFDLFGCKTLPATLGLEINLFEFRPARRNDNGENGLFNSIEYTKEVDGRIKDLIDGLIDLRLSHPHLVQLEIELLEELDE